MEAITSPNTILYFAVLAHLFYDFNQGAFVSEWKSKSLFILFIHSLAWAMLIGAVLWFGGIFASWKIIVLITTHMLFDGWKSKYETDIKNAWTLYVDQLGHLITIIIVIYIT